MRYKRLTMGTSPASGELTQRHRSIFANINNTIIIQDDIAIATTDLPSYDISFDDVSVALQTAGLTVSPNECLLDPSEIPFWGFKVTKESTRPIPEKVQAVQHADRPQNKDERKPYLCIICSNGQFIANLTELTQKHHL